MRVGGAFGLPPVCTPLGSARRYRHALPSAIIPSHLAEVAIPRRDSMKVLLLKEVTGLGEPGQVKEVVAGYARNYLLPQQLATIVTPATLRELEIKQAAEKKWQAKIDEEMKAVGQKMAGSTITLKAKAGEGGKLYGSITNADVAEALVKQANQTVDKRKIEIEEPVRHVGEYKIPIKLSRNVTTTVTLIVEGEEGE